VDSLLEKAHPESLQGEMAMYEVSRRSAVALGLAATSIAVAQLAAAQTTDPLAGKDASPAPGLVVRTFGEERSIIPGFNPHFPDAAACS
jgi:hypothetical protein